MARGQTMVGADSGGYTDFMAVTLEYTLASTSSG